MTGPAFGDIEKRTDIKFILEKEWTFQDKKNILYNNYTHS